MIVCRGFLVLEKRQVGVTNPGADILSDFVGTGDGDGASATGIHHSTKKSLMRRVSNLKFCFHIVNGWKHGRSCLGA